MPIFTAKVLGWCRCRPSDSKYPQIDVDPNSDVAKRVSIAPPTLYFQFIQSRSSCFWDGFKYSIYYGQNRNLHQMS